MSNSIDRGMPIQYGQPIAVYYGCMPAYPPIVPGDWPSAGEPDPVPLPIMPLSPEELAKRVAVLQPLLDEFALMAAIDKLDDAAKRRVHAWLTARLDMTPTVMPR